MSEISENKASHLAMIQNAINRMATASALFKGFAATFVAGITAASFANMDVIVLLIAVSPLFCFLILDIYYLWLEKRYRILFNMVRTNAFPADYCMAPPSDKATLRTGRARILDCVRSPSILLFYLPLIAIAAAVVVLNYMEVI